jgi:phosphoglycolate phosphatase-like HAD superfamily hydrolase
MTGTDNALSYTLILPAIDENHDQVNKDEIKTENEAENYAVLPIKGIIFDMDGTLTKPQTWMFGEMRSQLEVPSGVDILDHLGSLPTEEDKHIAELKLRAIEEKAMNEQEPTKGLLNIFTKLNNLGIKTSICTRNVPKPVGDFCKKFLNCSPYETDIHNVNDVDINNKKFNNNLISGPIVTREFYPPKPSPIPLLHIINSWGVSPKQVIMVGDSIDDMDAGLAAGCAVVLLRHEDNLHVENNYLIDELNSKLDNTAIDLDDLFTILQNGLIVKPRII